MYTCVYIYIYTHKHIYIYIERERYAVEDAKRPRLADGVTAASAGGGEWAQVTSLDDVMV